MVDFPAICESLRRPQILTDSPECAELADIIWRRQESTHWPKISIKAPQARTLSQIALEPFMGRVPTTQKHFPRDGKKRPFTSLAKPP